MQSRRFESIQLKTLQGASICAVDENYIYVTGGQYGSVVYKHCLRYSIRSNVWQRMEDMNQCRFSHSSCVLARYIYVFCGED